MFLNVDRDTANIQALAFGAAAVAGAISIVFLKLLELPQLVVTAVPVTVMLLYASLIIKPYFRARADQIGDNLYYLGFIFTLISLSISLAQFSAHGSAQDIIANFGIALATTLVGVALRVMFNQMRSDPLETEREARLQLAEAARRLKVELGNAAVEFSMAARASRQSMNDAVIEMQETLGRSLTSAASDIARMAAQAGETINTASDVLGNRVTAAGDTLSIASGSMRQAMDGASVRWREGADDALARNGEFNAAARRLVGTVERLANKIEAGLAPSEVIEAKLKPLGDAAVALEASFRTAREELTTAGAAAVQLLDQARTSAGAANETSAAARQAAAHVEEAAQTLAAAGNTVRQAEDLPQRLERALAALEVRLTSQTITFSDQLVEILGGAVEATRSERSLANDLIERLEEVAAEFRAARVRSLENGQELLG